MFEKIKKKIIISLLKNSTYQWFLINVIPYIRFTPYYTSMRGWKYHRGYKLLKRGDIVLTYDKNKATTILIPGIFAHAAFCVSKDKEFEIAEMTHSNFTKSTFSDICYEADRVVIIRCVDFSIYYINKMIERCKSFENVKYDTEFKLGVDYLYCSELIYHSDFEKKLDVSLEDLAGIGQDYISPDGLFKAKNIEIIWDSDKEKECH